MVIVWIQFCIQIKTFHHHRTGFCNLGTCVPVYWCAGVYYARPKTKGHGYSHNESCCSSVENTIGSCNWIRTINWWLFFGGSPCVFRKCEEASFFHFLDDAKRAILLLVWFRSSVFSIIIKRRRGTRWWWRRRNGPEKLCFGGSAHITQQRAHIRDGERISATEPNSFQGLAFVWCHLIFIFFFVGFFTRLFTENTIRLCESLCSGLHTYAKQHWLPHALYIFYHG